MSFHVSTDTFRGPIDLLLYLVRKHELDLTSLALSKITEQYIQFLEVLQEIDIDQVGEFIEVASILVEMKAKHALPKHDFESDEPQDDPREHLVERLLLFKQFKDAAELLDDKLARWQNRYRRIVDDLPPRKIDMADQPIADVELWDLVSAFGRILRDNLPRPETNIVYDETPITVYMQRIHARLVREQRIAFSSLFADGMHKSALIGVFLAVLELTRHHNVRAEQSDLHGEIWVFPGEGFDPNLQIADVDDYDPHHPKGDPASLVD